ncbi:hypothetical protein [Nocardia sp. NPDC047654]|uniref:hypothetical protein n=1 Tax=Nocardia sp. NPDC047654 TaxID=3364314 RepID=UPI003718C4A3
MTVKVTSLVGARAQVIGMLEKDRIVAIWECREDHAERERSPPLPVRLPCVRHG